MSQLQEIIHRTTHVAFESGRIAEQQRFLKLLKDAKKDAADYPSVPAYFIIMEVEKLVKAGKK